MKKNDSKKIAVIGSGIVGQATGKGFLDAGHDVVFCDTNPEIVRSLSAEGYSAMEMKDFGDRHAEWIDFFMISVPTPTKNGRVELAFLESALSDLGRVIRKIKRKPVFVVRSTVPPGTTKNIAISTLEKFSGKKAGKDFGVCMNPEFLREVSAQDDFRNPWMIVVGSDDKVSGEALAGIYKSFKSPIVRMSLNEAEMMKYAHNLLNATKISFFNEMRIVAKSIGADPEVMFPVIVKSAEAMWNPSYGIKNLGPYGGVCLPKDTVAFHSWTLETLGYEMPVLAGTIKTNELMKEIADYSEHPAENLTKQIVPTRSYGSMPFFKENILEKVSAKKAKIRNNFRHNTLSGLPL